MYIESTITYYLIGHWAKVKPKAEGHLVNLLSPQIMSLIPSSLTFSHDRLCKLWREFQPVRGRVYHDQYQYFGHISNHELQYPRATRQFCLRLYSSVQDPKDHLTRLVAAFDAINLRPIRPTKLSDNAVSSLLQL